MKRIERIDPSASAIEAKASVDIFEGDAQRRGQQIYRGARNTLYRVEAVDGGASSSQLCVKHFRRAKFPNSYIYGRFRSSKAFRSFEYAHRLLAAGFKTPRPIACCDIRRGLKLTEGYYICEYLDLPNMRDWGTHPDGDALVEAIAREMFKFHRAGILHRDFSPGNMLVRRNAPGDYDFYYVDLNRMNFGVHSTKKLMRMFRSISLDASETERLARAYARLAGQDEDAVVTSALKSLARYQRTKARHRAIKRLLRLGKK